MNSKNILSALGEISPEACFPEKAENAPSPRRRRFLPAAVAVACLLAAVIPAAHFLDTGSSDSSYTDAAGRRLWRDTRNYRSYPASAENAIIFPFEEQTELERWSSVSFNGIAYRTGGVYMDPSVLTEALGEADAGAYDITGDTKVISRCRLFAVDGFDPGDRIGVLLPDSERPILFVREDIHTALPETFGAALAHYGLSKYFRVAAISAGAVNETYDFRLTTDNGESLLAALSALSSSPAVADYSAFSAWAEAPKQPEGAIFTPAYTPEGMTGEASPEGFRTMLQKESLKKACLLFEAPALGLKAITHSITVWDAGYLCLNFDAGDNCYAIGREAAEELIRLTEKAEGAPADVRASHILAGIITEIGETYLKFDDSSLMKKEKDGIVFTVTGDNGLLPRYIRVFGLKPGDLIAVEYDGVIPDDGSFTISGLISISPAFLSDGEVLIPE